jgi:ABC-type transport system substrate-binding protein
MSWCDREFDRLHREATKETDPAKRHEMYVEMQRLWDEAAHTIWVAYRTKFFAFRAGLEPAIRPYGRYDAWAFREA